jgi:hypothetical protein
MRKVSDHLVMARDIARGATKMELKLIMGAALALTLGGCVSSSKALRNTNGDLITCKASGYGWLGAPVALINQGDCLRKYREQGYYALDEDPNLPKVAASALKYKTGVRLALPAGWVAQPLTAAQVSSGIKLYGLNQTLDAGIMFSTVKKSAISDFDAYVSSRRKAAQSVGTENTVTELELNEVGGYTQANYRATLTVSNVRYRYAYKIIRGASEIAIISVWSTDSNFDAIKPELENLVNSVEGL